MFSATRYHDISCGHRVTGHESKCAHFHGHNYRIHFFCTAKPLAGQLDDVGRVIDFSDIKTRLCEWIESRWDHKFLIWKKDADCFVLQDHDPAGVVITSFNPTAENMAKFLVIEMGPKELEGTDVLLYKVVVEETAKCSASYELNFGEYR